MDGVRKELVQADLAFKAVSLDPGSHVVIFRFNGNAGFAQKYLLLAILSVAAFLFGLVYFVTGRFQL